MGLNNDSSDYKRFESRPASALEMKSHRPPRGPPSNLCSTNMSAYFKKCQGNKCNHVNEPKFLQKVSSEHCFQTETCSNNEIQKLSARTFRDEDKFSRLNQIIRNTSSVKDHSGERMEYRQSSKDAIL